MDKVQRRVHRSSLVDRPSAGTLNDPIKIGADKSINIDLSKLPSPTNVYDADIAWVEHQTGMCAICFAKRSRDDISTFRTRLEIRYPAENLVKQFWRNSRTFHEKLKEFAEAWPKNDTRADLEPSKMKAAKDHSEWANFESLAYAGTEACIDFYRLPPTGIAMFARGQGSSGLKCTAVVRVQLTVFELLHLFESMKDVVATIEGYLPKAVVDSDRPALGEGKKEKD